MEYFWKGLLGTGCEQMTKTMQVVNNWSYKSDECNPLSNLYLFPYILGVLA